MSTDESPTDESPTDEPPTDEPPAALPPFAELVLELAERIPAGRVMTYGDVAEYLEGERSGATPPGAAVGRRVGGGPRQVGRVMALYGGSVPWWRVVRADGALLPGHELRALAHYRDEGTPLRPARGRGPARGSAAAEDLPRVDLSRARWDGR
ncbi:MGMT family protein [Streptacidiphilus sp. P02-A3a]|uniref:MGMT family protein n=1 Tax=Streptacidiphilus sp. P02-A3a TaxID=2704468 RepID=UPI00272AFC0A|nr:MGMT family protein [Streptacidiphilus sp. P02-A3a]